MFVRLIWLVLTVTAAASGADGAQDSTRLTTRPDPEGEPTPLSVGLFLVDIVEIDDVTQTFKADVIGTFSWRDPRLALSSDAVDRSDRVFSLDQIWNPGLTLINRRTVQILAPDVANVSAEGHVRVELRRFAEMSSPLDLRKFPFDVQALKIDIASTRYGPDQLALSVDETRTGRLSSFSIAGWEIDLGEVTISEIKVTEDEHVVRFVQHLTAIRDSTFFVMKVIVPLSLIVFMAWTVFWVDPEYIGPQLGISTASVLTLIAFQFSLVRMLPRVSYLTQIDLFLLGATVLVFLALGESIWTSRIAKAGRHEQAQRMDRIARWIYAVLFGGLLLITFLP